MESAIAGVWCQSPHAKNPNEYGALTPRHPCQRPVWPDPTGVWRKPTLQRQVEPTNRAQSRESLIQA